MEETGEKSIEESNEEYAFYRKNTSETDKVFSPSFCLAKWYHSNIYFQTGETHSCYHPEPHKIDLHEIAVHPSALHNTRHKIKERIQMLNGYRPVGCQYCWNIEDLDKKLISDRQIRTGSLYSEARVREIKENAKDFQVLPNYIEISFSNQCNFKCGYCHPKASSRYYKEIKDFGPYLNVKNHQCHIDWLKIYDEEDNPFIEAWWKWWPELSKSLKILRITGGEPVLQQSTYKMFSFLHEYPNRELELNVNSNMGSAKAIIEKFCLQAQDLVEKQKVAVFKLFTSIDTWGPQAEYIRTGLKLATFEENVRHYLASTKLPMRLMITFNIFSVVSFQGLLEKILEWRSQFNNENKGMLNFHRIAFDISYLKEPLQYDMNILPKDEFLTYMDSHLEFIKKNVDDQAKDKFSSMEFQRFLRVYEYMKNTIYSEEKIAEGRRDFYNFFREYDRRRNVSLLKTFPQMEGFWKTCQSLVAP